MQSMTDLLSVPLCPYSLVKYWLMSLSVKPSCNQCFLSNSLNVFELSLKSPSMIRLALKFFSYIYPVIRDRFFKWSFLLSGYMQHPTTMISFSSFRKAVFNAISVSEWRNWFTIFASMNLVLFNSINMPLDLPPIDWQNAYLG